jgi:uncharacterized protein
LKTLLTLAALLLLFWILRQLWRRHLATHRGSPPSVKQMVPCAHCGLYLPQDEAISQNGRYYCCTEHRDAASRT